MKDISLKLKKLFPGIEIGTDVVLQDDGEGVYVKHWNREEPEPTLSELEAVDVKDEIGNQEADEKRIAEYGDWRSQLDYIYHFGIDGWRAKVQEIKNKYPKK